VNVVDLALAKSKVNEPVYDVLAARAEGTNGDGSFTVADIVLLSKYLLKVDGAVLKVYKG
jgi:hypothetical protein